MKNNIIEDWLAEHGDPKIDKKVEKQLELEEAAEKLFPTCTTPLRKIGQKGFIAGAEWQSDQDKNKYSEEDVLKLLEEYGHDLTLADNLFEGTPKQWFERIKKK